MSTATTHDELDTQLDDRPTRPLARSHDATRALPLVGRIMFSAIFLASVPSHFSPHTVAYAEAAGVPMANIAVPLSGMIALFGGLSILLGYKAKYGAALLVLFLVPVTLMMHRFWGIADPQMAEMQMINFMKNVALTGGALMIAFFGAGPLSLDARIARTEARNVLRTD
jgi:putative oxidoreductase